MKKAPHPYERIERYINNDLSTEETVLLKQEMEASSELAQTVRLHQRMHEALSDTAVMELEDTLLRLRHGGSGQLRSIFRSRWLMAASVLLVLGLGLLLLWPSRSTYDYAEAFRPYPSYLSTRSVEKDAADLLNQADALYGAGNYEAALPLFQELATATPENKAVAFYAAYCQLELKRYGTARQSFLDIIQHGNSDYVQPAQWYLVRLYLETDEQAAAQELLREIMESKGDFAGLAREVLDEL